MRNGRERCTVTGWLETGRAENLRRERYQRNFRFVVFVNSRSAFGKTIQRRSDSVPWVTPQRCVIIRAGQDAFDMRQNQFICAGLIVNWLAGKLLRQRRADISR